MRDTGSITYGKESIDFDVLYIPRKTLEIAVHPDKQVVVTAPIGTGWVDIEKRVKKRARWINRQITYFRQYEPRTTARNYVSGETHLYLGRNYRLRTAAGETNEVKLLQGRMFVTLREVKAEKVKECLESWYREKALEKFPEVCEQCIKPFMRMGFEHPKLRIRRMRKRWGSLSKRGTLTLNLKLIHAPKECIEYVITHELCHLKFHDHSPGFYKLLERTMPDWERRKRRLELAVT